jgi:hypothetical protein
MVSRWNHRRFSSMDDRPGGLFGLPDWFADGIGRCPGTVASIAGLEAVWFP